MALDDFFGSHGADDIERLADAISAGEVAQERVDTLRERIEDTERTVIEDILAEQGFQTVAAWNVLEDALGLERTTPRVGEATDPGLAPEEPEVEERTEEEMEALERARDIMFRGQTQFSDAQLRDTKRAIESGNLEDAPVAVQGPLQRLAQEDLDTLVDEIDDALAERVGELVGEDEPERTAMDQFPGIQAATDRGPGRSVPYFRGVLQELQGEKQADRLPTDELRRVQNRSTVRQQFIEKVEQNIAQLEAQQQRRGTQRPSISGGQVDMSQTARRIVPPASRRDPSTGEQWTASPEQVQLERSFMEFVLQTKPNRNRWDDGFLFRHRPENRDISMQQWARLMVEADNASVSEATRLGLPESWFEGDPPSRL